MKKFIISVLCAAVFFIGLGGLIQDAGARFKSDERALDLIKQARQAIGGEEAVGNVKAMTIKAAVSKTFALEEGSRTEQGDFEINLQLPNQFGKQLKFTREDGGNGDKLTEVKKEFNVVVVMNDGNGNSTFKQAEPNADKQGVFVIKRGEGDKVILNNEANGDAVKRILVDKDMKVSGMNFHQNEMFRTTLALLLSAPQGVDTTFTYAGEADVDGNVCDIVEAANGNSSVKLFLDKSSHLPRMMSYQGMKPLMFKLSKDDKNEALTSGKIIVNKLDKLDKPEMAEFQIRFADYRSVNGVLLPYRWTQTIGGNADETVDVSSYEINPANIAEKFQAMPTKVFVRTEKKAQ